MLSKLKNFLYSLRIEGAYVETYGDVVTIHRSGVPTSNAVPPWRMKFNGRGIVSLKLTVKNLKIIDYVEDNHSQDYVVVLPKGDNHFLLMVFDGKRCVFESKMKFFKTIKRVFW